MELLEQRGALLAVTWGSASLIDTISFWGSTIRWSRSLSWGYAASVVKVEGQEQAGRQVEHMPSVWLSQVALHFCGGWGLADLPLRGGQCRHLWEEGVLLDLLHCEHSPIPSHKMVQDIALIKIQRVEQCLVYGKSYSVFLLGFYSVSFLALFSSHCVVSF